MSNLKTSKNFQGNTQGQQGAFQESRTSDGVSRLGLGLETCLETRFLESWSPSRRILVSFSSSSSRDFV